MTIEMVIEVDMRSLAIEIENHIKRKIRRLKLIKTTKMHQSVKSKSKRHMNVKGQPREIVVEAIEYYKYQDEGTVTISANHLTPGAKEIKGIIQKIMKMKRRPRRTPRFKKRDLLRRHAR